MGPDGIHRRVLRDLGEALPEPLPITDQQPWPPGEVPAELPDVTPIHKEGQKEDPGNCQPDLVPGEAVEQVTPSAITQHLRDSRGSGPGPA